MYAFLLLVDVFRKVDHHEVTCLPLVVCGEDTSIAVFLPFFE